MTWEGLNRRKFPRANFPCLVKVLGEGQKEDVVLTHTENLSVGGVCVIIKRSLEIFAPVTLELDLMDGGELIVCRAKVVWSVRRKALEELKPSFYDVGFEFLDIKDEQRARVAATIDHLVRFGRGSAVR